MPKLCCKCCNVNNLHKAPEAEFFMQVFGMGIGKDEVYSKKYLVLFLNNIRKQFHHFGNEILFSAIIYQLASSLYHVLTKAANDTSRTHLGSLCPYDRR